MANSHSFWAGTLSALASPASSIACGIAASALFTIFHGFLGRLTRRRRDGRRALLRKQIEKVETLRSNDQFTTWMVTHFMFRMVRGAGFVILFVFYAKVWAVGLPKLAAQGINILASILGGWYAGEFLSGAFSGVEYHEIFLSPDMRIARLKKKLLKLEPKKNDQPD